jgi:hypothetical protein
MTLTSTPRLDSAGNEIDCEWTVGAFAELARA